MMNRVELSAERTTIPPLQVASLPPLLTAATVEILFVIAGPARERAGRRGGAAALGRPGGSRSATELIAHRRAGLA